MPKTVLVPVSLAAMPAQRLLIRASPPYPRKRLPTNFLRWKTRWSCDRLQILVKPAAGGAARRSSNRGLMTRVLRLGYDPETVDFSDPALPPGMTVEKIRSGIAVALQRLADRGWQGDIGLIRFDETAGPTVKRQLALKSYDCVVIGAGVGLPARGLGLFEAVINAIPRVAPGAAIAFHTRPEDSADAAARWLAAEGGAV